MNKYKLFIWGREFELSVCYDCYPGEDVLDIQRDAFCEFCNDERLVDMSKNEVEKYILNHDSEKSGLEKIDNIFKYVMPKSIYVPRNEEKRVVVLLCDYKFDMEHGMAIVFENEQVRKIGRQDMIF